VYVNTVYLFPQGRGEGGERVEPERRGGATGESTYLKAGIKLPT
jgi:hypothetical protein